MPGCTTVKRGREATYVWCGMYATGEGREQRGNEGENEVLNSSTLLLLLLKKSWSLAISRRGIHSSVEYRPRTCGCKVLTPSAVKKAQVVKLYTGYHGNCHLYEPTSHIVCKGKGVEIEPLWNSYFASVLSLAICSIRRWRRRRRRQFSTSPSSPSPGR